MPADERRTVAEFIEQARRLQQDVWTNKLFHAIEHARVRAQVPRPLEEEVWSIQPGHAAAKRQARLFDRGAKVRDFSGRQNRDRMEESQLFVVQQLFAREHFVSSL